MFLRLALRDSIIHYTNITQYKKHPWWMFFEMMSRGGLELYEFSTPIGWIACYAINPAQSGFEPPDKIKTSRAGFLFVSMGGLEPPTLAL